MTDPMTRPSPPATDPPGTEGIRLARRVAELASCSRREAELYIEGGWVRVNGEVVEVPQFRVQDQTVELDPAALRRPATAPAPITLVLHKPPGVIDDARAGESHAAIDLLTANRRDPADRSGIRLLQRHLRGLDNVTPLETGACGLMVFTQDWRVKRKLVDDAALVEHEVMVEVAGTVSPAALQQLNQPPVIDGRAMLAARVSISRQTAGVTGLRFALKGYATGQIAHMCGAAGLQLTAIKRLRIGRLPLAGLAEGQWRFLMPYERF
jgi:23S rRNA pseudouridine2604 synthase